MTIRRYLTAVAATAMAISLIGLSASALLIRAELRELKEDDSQMSETLQSQMHDMEEENQKLSKMLLDQRALAHMAAMPGKSTIMLEGEEAYSQSRGMIMISPTGTWGILAALQLEQLPEGKAYQLWLIANDRSRTSGGVFTVDDTGYGLLEIRARSLLPLTKPWGCPWSLPREAQAPPERRSWVRIPLPSACASLRAPGSSPTSPTLTTGSLKRGQPVCYTGPDLHSIRSAWMR